jgi:hypothetical protein
LRCSINTHGKDTEQTLIVVCCRVCIDGGDALRKLRCHLQLGPPVPERLRNEAVVRENHLRV